MILTENDFSPAPPPSLSTPIPHSERVMASGEMSPLERVYADVARPPVAHPLLMWLPGGHIAVIEERGGYAEAEMLGFSYRWQPQRLPQRLRAGFYEDLDSLIHVAQDHSVQIPNAAAQRLLMLEDDQVRYVAPPPRYLHLRRGQLYRLYPYSRVPVEPSHPQQYPLLIRLEDIGRGCVIYVYASEDGEARSEEMLTVPELVTFWSPSTGSCVCRLQFLLLPLDVNPAAHPETGDAVVITP
ncbi:hypothetical protein FA95DRAFT_1611150 [Auriscalpium vulgare]|uniref:Uncharacterized protein n=1 Tax=Auriscalpium vulgare TaxID=40419 RepID=A0ACB8RB61_9AGAM|nr:hypothetical protein FA95DRAFT_1611150 [Auriscalpium vulgare]